MARVFDGTLHAGYHFVSLETASGDGHKGLMPDVCFAGQVNGLCGAAMRGVLLFITGLHHGAVGLTVDVLSAAPPLDESWEEIVEVSFGQEDEEAVLVHFYGPAAGTFALPSGTYRVRYSAKNMDYACGVDTHINNQPIDFYSLIFWPALLASDAILKQTGKFAKYSHQSWGNPPS